MIEIRNFSFAYAPEKLALFDINLQVARGQKLALVGPNGAGKTTLLLQLNGILRGQGSLRVGELDLKDDNLPAIRAQVGLLFQSPDDQLFSNSVFDDVAYGLRYQGLAEEQIAERAARALEHVGMHGLAQCSPLQLSLGEKKRAALASVLCMQPEVLALDEPSSGLDPRGRRGIIRLLQQLPQTMLIATHDLDLVGEVCSQVAVMDAGRLVRVGSSETILSDHALLTEHGLRA